MAVTLLVVNPTALLMNDVAVASLAFGIVGNSKVMPVCTFEYSKLHVSDVTL